MSDSSQIQLCPGADEPKAGTRRGAVNAPMSHIDTVKGAPIPKRSTQAQYTVRAKTSATVHRQAP
jgi:hypothetical protein